MSNLVDALDALLPQTQCEQCGYPGCRPYAQALALGQAANNLCIPGQQITANALAELLGQEPLTVPPNQPGKKIARIDPMRCIGCTLCIQACPVDAIIGAPKQMHSVISDDCTGCQLCVAPCPTDCIDIVTMDETTPTWSINNPALAESSQRAREHATQRRQRLLVKQRSPHQDAPNSQAILNDIRAIMERKRAQTKKGASHD